jgi:hypothetical protein
MKIYKEYELNKAESEIETLEDIQAREERASV